MLQADAVAVRILPEHDQKSLPSLSLEVVQLVCEFLHYKELLAISSSCAELSGPALNWTACWERAAIQLLGLGPCCLHVCEANRSGKKINAEFWRRKCRAAVELTCCRWSQTMRRKFIETPPGLRPSNATSCTSGTGHVSVILGEFVFKVGGMGRHYATERMTNQDPVVETFYFDLRKQRMGLLRLTKDTALPEQRVRHAACLVKPPRFGSRPMILLLGGWNDYKNQPCVGGLRTLHLLEPLKENRHFRGRWHTVEAEGSAPATIWHHTSGSFQDGRKVVVFGGNFKADDPEYPTIAQFDGPAKHVYILDLDSMSWSRMATTGAAPKWRSLHSSHIHYHYESGRGCERLIVLGGCEQLVEVFSTPADLPPLHGFALDLSTMHWTSSSTEGEQPNMPVGRARMAVAQIANWLVLYGGHGPEMLPLTTDSPNLMFKMNLSTLKWSTFQVFGYEVSLPGAPCATMTSNLLIGGIAVSTRGFGTPPKFEVLMVCDSDYEGTDRPSPASRLSPASPTSPLSDDTAELS